MATAETLALLTAQKFFKRPAPGCPEELVRGRVVVMSLPDRRHGYIRSRVDRLLGQFADEHDIGCVICNDSAVITERCPDTARGASVAFYSYNRLPRGPLASGYGPEVPELVVEVRSSNDRWRQIHEKFTEYLNAGVLCVVLLNPESRVAHVFNADDAPRMLGPDHDLTLTGILEGFRVRVGKFFE